MLVKIPATSANLGPGFDCIGMSLNLYNYINFEKLEENNQLSIIIEGEGKECLEQNANNLSYKAFKSVFTYLEKPVPGIQMKFTNNIPLARGLGSSAAAVIGGLLIGNSFLEKSLDEKELLSLAVEFEGHPDNIAPALLGGIIISSKVGEDIKYTKIIPPSELGCSVLVPNFELSTKKAREVLPNTISLEDAVFNVSRVAFLVSALYSNNLEMLSFAMEDKLHQPFRSQLIPGLQEIFEKGKELDVFGIAISGAGPSILIFHHKNRENTLYKLQNILDKYDVSSRLLSLEPTVEGATII